MKHLTPQTDSGTTTDDQIQKVHLWSFLNLWELPATVAMVGLA